MRGTVCSTPVDKRSIPGVWIHCRKWSSVDKTGSSKKPWEQTGFSSGFWLRGSFWWCFCHQHPQSRENWKDAGEVNGGSPTRIDTTALWLWGCIIITDSHGAQRTNDPFMEIMCSAKGTDNPFQKTTSIQKILLPHRLINFRKNYGNLNLNSTFWQLSRARQAPHKEKLLSKNSSFWPAHTERTNSKNNLCKAASSDCLGRTNRTKKDRFVRNENTDLQRTLFEEGERRSLKI